MNKVFVLTGDLNSSLDVMFVSTTKEKLIEKSAKLLEDYCNKYNFEFDFEEAHDELLNKNFWIDTYGNCFWLKITETEII